MTGRPASGYAARFYPQEWDGTEPHAADPVSGVDWPITDAEAAIAIDDWGAHGTRDYMRNHPNAPQWVRDWEGSYTLGLIGPDGLDVPLIS